MTLLQPLALVAAAVIPLILLLYMLKRRTRLQPVSSTMLWEKLDQTAAAAININRLLKNLLLLLQLITAALLVLALAYPAASRRAGAGAVSDSIVIVDTSVSMAVQEGEGRRLDRAAELLQEMISGKGAGSRMGIIGMGERATMISGVTADPAALRKAAGSLVINGARANLKEALVLAENMAHALENPQIIIISAGGFEDAGLRLDYPLRYLPVGEKEVENLYLQEMVLDGSRLYLTVANNGTRPARGTVRIRDAEGSAVGQREVSLEPGESRLLTWRQLPASPWYRGEISSPRDQLPGDSEFYLVNSGYWENRLLLVTAGNPFLEQALLLQESLQVSRIKPEQYRPSMGEAYDYFVFDGYLPEELPAAPLLVFDPPHPNPHLQSSPPVLRPELRPLDHPPAAPRGSFGSGDRLRQAAAGRRSLYRRPGGDPGPSPAPAGATPGCIRLPSPGGEPAPAAGLPHSDPQYYGLFYRHPAAGQIFPLRGTPAPGAALPGGGVAADHPRGRADPGRGSLPLPRPLADGNGDLHPAGGR